MYNMLEINVSPCRNILGQSKDEHNVLCILIENSLKNNLKYYEGQGQSIKIDIYNMCHNRKDIVNDNKQRLIIFIDCTTTFAQQEEIYLDEPLKLDGIETDEFKQFFAPEGTGTIIYSENDIALAEFFPNQNVLNILFNPLNKKDNFMFFEYIIKKFNDVCLYKIFMSSSWKLDENKANLTTYFTNVIKRSKEQNIQNDIRAIESWKRNLNEYKSYIKSVVDNIAQAQRRIVVEKENLNNISQNLIKDLDLIVNHPKIQDLHIKNNRFIIYTNPLNIHADNGKKYYGGKYRIELDPENVAIYFFGDNPRKGYWTDHDPHPHVNGNCGEACLGNTESTIAELSAQMQIYALALISIDFLEAANTNDAAGCYIRNWDEIDDNGNIIPAKNKDYSLGMRLCDCCSDYFYDSELNTVYEEVLSDDGFEDDFYVNGERYVCENCLEEHCHYDECVDEYIMN